MKIKTIVHDHPNQFDAQVNQFLGEGYLLEERGVMPVAGDGKTYHYARLVLLDPPAEPEEVNPWKLLHQIQEVCNSVTDDCNHCPIKDWCFGPLKQGDDPTDWELPEVDA